MNANNLLRGDPLLPPAAAAAPQGNADCVASSSSSSPFRLESDLTRVLPRDDPARMKLTEEENENALAIKEMVEGMPDLDNLSDFMYAQLALICEDNVEDAINRCFGMQDFRREYGLVDSLQEGSRYLRWGINQFPLHFVNFEFHEATGMYFFVVDMDKIRFSAEMVEEFGKLMYYSVHLFVPDMEAVRRGYISVSECQGMSMRKDVLKHFGRFSTEFLGHYPFICKSRLFHTSAMVNVIVSMLRKLLPDDLFEVGLQFDGHIGETFLVPTVQEANARTLNSMVEALKLRYDNEKSFSIMS